MKGVHPDQVSQRVSATAASIDAPGIPWDDGDETWEDEDVEQQTFTMQDIHRQEAYDSYSSLYHQLFFIGLLAFIFFSSVFFKLY